MQNRNYAVVAFLSAALIGLEIIWTRIFSAEFFYTFAFLTLSLAILGLGLGALAIRLYTIKIRLWQFDDAATNSAKHSPYLPARIFYGHAVPQRRLARGRTR